jgi:cysteine-rich repeat protein
MDRVKAPPVRWLLSLAALGATATGCGLVLGIHEVSGDGLAAGGGGAASTASSGSGGGATSSSSGGGASTTSSSTSSSSGAAACGNGVKEPGEACDGADLGGQTCVDLGYVAPAGLACTGCALDGSGCAAVCGNGTVEPGEDCDDGNGVDGDGCTSACKAEGTTCANAIAVNVNQGGQQLTGTTVGGGAHAGSTCPASAGPDRVYRVTAQMSGYLTLNLPRAHTSFDSVLYVAQSCDDMLPVPDQLCADSHGGATPLGGEVLSLPVTAGQSYYVYVDARTAAEAGTFQLSMHLNKGTDCGDPVPLELAPGSPMTVLGANPSQSTPVKGSCGGATGGEVVYKVSLDQSGPLTVATDVATTNFNAVLYARASCNVEASELVCSNQPSSGPESISLPAGATAGNVFVFVDGSGLGGGNPAGNFGLVFTP